MSLSNGGLGCLELEVGEVHMEVVVGWLVVKIDSDLVIS